MIFFSKAGPAVGIELAVWNALLFVLAIALLSRFSRLVREEQRRVADGKVRRVDQLRANGA